MSDFFGLMREIPSQSYRSDIHSFFSRRKEGTVTDVTGLEKDDDAPPKVTNEPWSCYTWWSDGKVTSFCNKKNHFNVIGYLYYAKDYLLRKRDYKNSLKNLWLINGFKHAINFVERDDFSKQKKSYIFKRPLQHNWIANVLFVNGVRITFPGISLAQA